MVYGRFVGTPGIYPDSTGYRPLFRLHLSGVPLRVGSSTGTLVSGWVGRWVVNPLKGWRVLEEGRRTGVLRLPISRGFPRGSWSVVHLCSSTRA